MLARGCCQHTSKCRRLGAHSVPCRLACAPPVRPPPAAMAVVEERGEATPLQPAHIHAAYQRLIEADKVPGKAPRRHALL